MTPQITKIRQTNHFKQATHAGLHINPADLHVKQCSNLSRSQTRGFAWTVPPLARGAGRGCESPIIKHSVDNILLLIVLINPLLGTFSVLDDFFNYVVTL
jgi:hypothetical protein